MFKGYLGYPHNEKYPDFIDVSRKYTLETSADKTRVRTIVEGEMIDVVILDGVFALNDFEIIPKGYFQELNFTGNQSQLDFLYYDGFRAPKISNTLDSKGLNKESVQDITIETSNPGALGAATNTFYLRINEQKVPLFQTKGALSTDKINIYSNSDTYIVSVKSEGQKIYKIGEYVMGKKPVLFVHSE